MKESKTLGHLSIVSLEHLQLLKCYMEIQYMHVNGR